MAIHLALAMGGTPIGAPIVGWVADTFGPRWAMGVGAAAGVVAAGVGVRYLVKYRGLRVRVERGRIRISVDEIDRVGGGQAVEQRGIELRVPAVPRRPGAWRGRVRIAEDFDAPLPEAVLAIFESGEDPVG
jgi:hypothetical protein